MALGPSQLNKFTEMSVMANQLINDMEPKIEQIDALFNGAPNWMALVTQPAIDEVGSLKSAGLTVQNVADMIYTLNLVKADMANLVALSMFAGLR
jgi:hypothetical protein